MGYQTIKTLHKYLKLIDIKKQYPDNYKEMLCLFMRRVSSMLDLCNEETIHIPLEGLVFLS